MNTNIQQLAAMVAIIEKSIKSVDGCINIYISKHSETEIHLRNDVFLSNYSDYATKDFSDECNKIFVNIDGVEIFALVDKEVNENAS